MSNSAEQKLELIKALEEMTNQLNDLSETAVEFEKLHGFPHIENANDLAALVARDTALAIAPVVGLLVTTVVGLLDQHEN